MKYKELSEFFKERYLTEARIFRSPGRINIIGEHTDYNDGFVLPAAVDKEIKMAAAPSDSELFTFYSVDEHQEVQFKFEDRKKISNGWAQYIIGVVDQLVKSGYKVPAFNAIFTGNVPMGAGMSSSAALECVTAYAINSLYELNLDKKEMILTAQKAENEYVGVNCGIMDQFASMFSEKDHAFQLDCRTLDYQSYSLNLEDYDLILVNSEVKHSLGSSEYNVRRRECEEGVKFLQGHNNEIRALRDVPLALLQAHKNSLDPVVYKRCEYVVKEIERVHKACKSMGNNDLPTLGKLLYETHEGLQHDYEVSCPELDFLVEFTKDKDSVLGSRMMGGGFGGCTLNLVSKDYSNEFIQGIKEAYHQKFNITPGIYQVTTADGTSEIKL